MKENGDQYFDLDILPFCGGKVFVDLGSYTGDTLLSFLKAYGDDYRHIHCYEMSEESAEILKRNAARHSNITIHQKAIGAEHKYLFMQQTSDLSASHLTEENTSTPVEIVTLDEDISEHVGIIKIDSKGAEQDALNGAVRHKKEEHPALIVCTYHGYEDIWKIPRIIWEMSAEYRFYMRHYGGNLIPTEFVLFAV